MKKIIYSLVIMIAAGSLFTSCIEQVEPLGIQDMRFAKAEYIRALKDLRAADAELQRAKAAVEQANARYRDAQTAYQNALTENQKLLNEYQELLNEARSDSNEVSRAMYEAMIEALELSMEEARAQHAITMVNLEKDMAVAQYNLNKTLRDIAMAAKDLTPMEKKALASAAALYLALSEQVKDQIIEVAQKQYTLDSLIAIKNTKTDKVWDGDSYVAKVDYWKAKIAELEEEVAGYEEAKKNAPEVADLDAWSAELKKYEDAKTQLEYSRAQVTKDSAAFMVTIHDGYTPYKDAIEDYLEDNDLNPVTDLVTDGHDNYWMVPFVEPEDPEGGMYYKNIYPFKDTEGLIGDDPTYEYVAGTEFGAKPTTAVKDMPKLDVDKLSPAAKSKLNSLLTTYKTVNIKDLGVKNLISNDGKFTLTDDVTADMKDFILGDEEGETNSQELYRYNTTTGEIEKVATASYGLVGAYTVLSRKDVIDEKTLTDYEAQLERAKNKWSSDRDILAPVYNAWKSNSAAKYASNSTIVVNEGTATEKTLTKRDSLALDKFSPFADSVAILKNKETALHQAVADSTTKADDMVTATTSLIGVLDNMHVNLNTWRTDDTTAFINAVKAFATARETFFGSKVEKKKAKYDTRNDYFHYSKATSPLILDSVKFSALKIEDLRKTDDRETPDVYKSSFGYNTSGAWVDGGAVVAILQELLNTAVVTKFKQPSEEVTVALVVGDMDCFYGQFKLVNKTATTYKFMKGDNEMPAVANAERTAVKNAKGGVTKAYNAYANLSGKFWGNDFTGFAQKYDPKAYDEASFITPFPVVAFGADSTQVVANTDVLAILGSVDPNAEASDPTGVVPFGPGTYVTGSAIFGEIDGKASEFASYMYWLSKISTIEEQDLPIIKAWIDAVDARFDEFKAAAVAKAKAAYEYDEAVYVVKEGTFDKTWTAYKELVGTKVNIDGDTVLYGPIVKSINEPAAGYNVTGEVNTPWTGAAIKVINPESGKWLIKGKQAEFAEQYLPKFAATFGELYERDWKIGDEIAHNDIILNAMKPAYLAAAKVAKYDEYKDANGGDQTMNTDSWDKLIADYKAARKKYVNDLDDLIKGIKEGTADKNIPAYKKLIADFAMYVDDANVDGTEMPYVMMQIAEAQLELESATQKLGAMQQALAYAKANLDRILEYVKSETDASVLLPFLYEIENNKDESISQLSQYGIIINLESLIDQWFSFDDDDLGGDDDGDGDE